MATGPARRPVSAFALSLASGILVVLGAFVLLLISFGFFTIFGLLGLAFGTIILFAAVLMYARPREHAIWGVIVLVFACVSIVSIGGFIAGMILGIIGGALAIAWRPEGPAFSSYVPGPTYGGYGGTPTMSPYGGGSPSGAYGVPVTPWRMCMGCGRWVPWAYNVCPLCGTQTPIASWVPRAAEAPPAATSPPPGAYVASPPAPMAAPAYTAPTPAPLYGAAAAPSSPPVKAPCPTCTGDAEWNASAARWYCPAESKYF